MNAPLEFKKLELTELLSAASNRSCLTLIRSVLVQWSDTRLEDVVFIGIVFCKLKHMSLSLHSSFLTISFHPPLSKVRHRWMLSNHGGVLYINSQSW